MNMSPRKIAKTFIPLILFAGMVWLSLSINPETLIASIGERNTYLALGVLGMASVLSAFTATPFYAGLGIAILGGLDPVLLAFVVGTSVTIGDTIFLMVLENGVDAIAQRVPWLVRLSQWAEKRPRSVVQWLTYLYFAYAPLASELFIGFLALTRTRPRDIWLHMLLGNYTFYLLIGLIAKTSQPLFERLTGA
jgi:hypothetical protein